MQKPASPIMRQRPDCGPARPNKRPPIGPFEVSRPKPDRPPVRSCRSAAVPLWSLALLGMLPAEAVLYWDANGGSSGTGNWNTSSSLWRNGSDIGVLQAWTNSGPQDAYLAGTAGTLTLTSAITVHDITLNPVSGNYAIAGGTLTFAGAAPTIDFISGGTLTISSVVAGSAGLNVSNGTVVLAGNNTFSGKIAITRDAASLIDGVVEIASISGLGTAPATATPDHITLSNSGTLRSTGSAVTIGSTQGITITGAGRIETLSSQAVLTINAPITGGSLYLSSAGLIVLGAANTHAGTTLQGGGVVRFAHANALPGSLTLQEGTTLALTAASGNFTGSANFTGSGGFSAYGTNRSVNIGGQATPQEISWNHSGILCLGDSLATHTIDFRNPLAIAFGETRTVWVGNGSAAVDARLSGTLDGFGANLVKSGAGTLEISGDNSSSGLDLEVGEGSVRLIGGNAIDDNCYVTLNAESGASLVLFDDETIAGIRETFTVSNATVNLNGHTLGLSENSSTFYGTITGSGNLTIASLGWGETTLLGNNTFAGNIVLNGANLRIESAANLGASTNTVVFDGGKLVLAYAANLPQGLQIDAGGGAVNFAGTTVLAGDIDGTGMLALVGHSNIRLTGTNTHSGGTSILYGTVEIANDAKLGAASAGAVIGFDGTIRVTGGDTTSTRGFVLEGNAGDHILSNDSGTWTIAGAISGDGLLVKAGAGRLDLTGPGTRTGGTRIDDGVLVVNAYSDLGAVPATADSDHVNMAGGAFQSTANLTLGVTRGFKLTNAYSTIITDAGTSLTIPGVITGLGSLRKQGDGLLTLSGLNTYSGTFIEAGTLAPGNAAALGTDTIWFEGGTLRFSSGFTEDISARVSGPALSFDTYGRDIAFSQSVGQYGDSLMKQGAGALVLEQGFDGTSIGVSGGILRIGKRGTWDLAVSVSSGATLELTDANSYNPLSSLSGSGDVVLGSNEIQIRGSGNSVFSGRISGSGDVSKAGTGHLELSGQNSFTGSLEVLQGTLTVSGGSAIADTVRVYLSSSGGATLALGGDETIGSLHDTDLTSSTAIVDLGGHTLTTGGDNTDSSFRGTIGGSGGLTKRGTGTMTLDGNNTFTGAVRVDGGTLLTRSDTGLGNATNSITLDAGILQILGPVLGTSNHDMVLGSGGGTLDVATSNHTVTWQGELSGSGGFTKTGTGTLVLESVASTYQGDTTINQGTLRIGAAGVIPDFRPVTVAAGAGLELTTHDERIRGLQGSGSVGLGTSGTLAIDAVEACVFSGNITGSGGVTIGGAASQTFSGINSYSGSTGIVNGRLIASGGNAIGNASAVILANDYDAQLSLTASETIGSLAGGGSLGGHVSLGTYTLTVGGNGQDSSYAGNLIGPGDIVKTGAGSLTLTGSNSYGGTTISGGRLTGNVGSIRGNILNTATVEFNQASDATYAGQISGTGALVKSGAGQLTLTGANSYSGRTTISGGALVIASEDRLGSAPTFLADRLDLQGGTLETTATMALGANRGVTLGAAGGAFEVAADTTLTVAAPVAGSGRLAKAGAGLLVLNGSNSYAGGTTIEAGTLRGTTASIRGSVVNNGTLELAQDINGVVGSLSGSGGLRKTGTGTVTLTTNTQSGKTAVFGGAIQISGVVQLGAVPGSYTADSLTLDGGTIKTTGTSSWNTRRGVTLGGGGGTFEVAGGTRIDLAAIVTGSGSLTKTGGGTLSLTGLNTYTGPSTISEGVLSGNATSLPGNIANNATLEFAQAADATYAGQISGSGALVKSGAGQLALTGANNYSGRTTISGGALLIDSADLLGLAPTFLADRLELQAGTLVTTATMALGTNRGVTLGATGGAFEVAADTTLTVAAPVTGSGGLAKAGAGLLVLSGSNSYAGNTTIEAGTLRGTTASIRGSVVNDGTIELAQDIAGTAPDLSGTGRLVKSGTGTLTMAGNTQSGGITVNGGIVSIASDAQFGALPGGYVPDFVTLDGGTVRGNGISWNSNRGLTLGGGGGTLDVPSAAYSFDMAARITGAGGLTKSGNGLLILSGTNDYLGATTVAAGELSGSPASLPGDVAVAADALVSFDVSSDTIYTARISGAGSLNKGGNGVFKLAAAQAYTGWTTVSQGGIRLGIDNALSDQTIVGLWPGTLFDLSTHTETIGGLAGWGSVSFAGGQLEIACATGQTFSGDVTGTGRLVKSGAGSLDLLGTTSNSGVAMTVDAGRLRGNTASLVGDITNHGEVEFYQADAGTATCAISGPGTLIKTGGGSLKLDAPNTFTGGVHVDAGTLQIGRNDALAAGTLVRLAAGTTFDLDGNSSLLNLDLTGAMVVTGAGVLTAGSAGVTTRASSLTSSIRGTLELAGGAKMFDVADGAAGVDLEIAADLTGSGGGLTKTGGGTLMLSGDNDYTGTLAIHAGTVRTGTIGALSPAGGIGLNGGSLDLNGYSQTMQDLEMTGGSIVTGSGTLTINGAATSRASYQSASVMGNLIMGAGAGTFVVEDGQAAADLTITGTLNGETGLTKLGAGTLYLATESQFTGEIRVEEGTLRGTCAGSLPASVPVFVGAGATLTTSGFSWSAGIVSLAAGTVNTGTSGAMILTDRVESLASSNSSRITGRMDLGGETRQFDVADGAAADDLELQARVTSSGGGLRKTGPGVLVLSAVNTYTGPTVIEQGGALRAAAHHTLPTGSEVSVVSNTLDLSGTNQTVGSLALTGSTVTTGTGLLTLDGTLTTMPDSASSVIDGRLDLATRPGVIGGIDGAADDDLVIGAEISGTAGLTIDSTGTVVLHGNNTFTGGLVARHGTLAVGGDANLGGAANDVTLGAGATLRIAGSTFGGTARDFVVESGGGRLEIADPGHTFELAGSVGGAGRFSKAGDGTLVLSGTSTNLLDVNIEAGRLRLEGAAALQADVGIAVNTGATLDLGAGDRSIDHLDGSGMVDLGSSTLTMGGAGGTSEFSGSISGTGGFRKTGSGTFTFTGDAPNTFSGATVVDGGHLVIARSARAISDVVTINAGALVLATPDVGSPATRVTLGGGELDVQGNVLTVGRFDVAGEVTIRGDGGRIHGLFAADGESVVTIAGSGVTLGASEVHGAFRAPRQLTVADGARATLDSRSFALLGALTTLEGGCLAAPNGIVLGSGGVLTGHGSVEGRIASAFGSTIEVTGMDVMLGDDKAFDGFYSDGWLSVGSSVTRLMDRDLAVLGSLTTVGDLSTGTGGSILATNGMLLERGKTVVGFGHLDGIFCTDGFVEGTGTNPGDGLRFSGLVTGIGDFGGNITFAGGYEPGHSPDAVHFENLTLVSGNTLLMELGGLAADSQYDQLLIGGAATLGGVLNVSLINGFTPGAGDLFSLFVGSLSGEFDSVYLPTLADGLLWDTSHLYSSGTLEVGTTLVPAPTHVTATTLPGLAARVGWDSLPEALSVEVDRARDAGFTDDLHTVALGAGQNGFECGGLDPETAYHFRLRAVGTAGNSPDSAPVQITTPTRLQDWRWLHFGDPTPVGIGADNEDPDCDGSDNLMEYACNLDPNLPDTATLTPDGTAGVPMMRLMPGRHLEYVFLRRTQDSRPAIAQQVEFSDDLAAWQDEPGASVAVEAIDGLWERVCITDPTQPGPRRFARQVVTASP